MMKEKTVIISIVMPTYNSSDFIVETIKSVLSQGFQNWELLITDDCSTDGTVEVINTHFNDRRIKIAVNAENSGAAVTRNNSIDRSIGDYIAFLDADDLWGSDKLSLQLQLMQDNDYSFTYTAYELIDEGGKKLNRLVDLNNTKSVSYIDMLKKKSTLGCSTVMVKRDVFNDLRMPDIRTGQDYATWLLILKKVGSAFCVNNVLTQYRIVPGSISRNKIKKAKRQWEIYRELEHLSILYSSYCFLFYAYRAVFRK